MCLHYQSLHSAESELNAMRSEIDSLQLKVQTLKAINEDHLNKEISKQQIINDKLHSDVSVKIFCVYIFKYVYIYISIIFAIY